MRRWVMLDRRTARAAASRRLEGHQRQARRGLSPGMVFLLVALIPVALVAGWMALAVLLEMADGLARMHFRGRAIADITRLSRPAAVDAEVARMTAIQAARPLDHEGWLGDHLLLCADGDWLVFRHRVRHGRIFAADQLYARDNHGQWYYSEHHFCTAFRGAVTLFDGPPASVAAFVQTYQLRPIAVPDPHEPRADSRAAAP